jgi:Ankyrin repeats (3 copies)
MPCKRCRRDHTTESCVIDSSIDGTEGELDRSDVFMFGPIDMRIILLLTTEVWQLLLSYLPVRDVIPALPLTNKFMNQIVWGEWSGPLLWGEMTCGRAGIDAEVFSRYNTRYPTALFRIVYCVYDAPLEHLKTILRGGANVNDRNVFGHTPLWIASEGGHPDYVRVLLEANADPNIVDQNGYTPLMRSVYLDNPRIALQLIRGGTDVNHADEHGVTALKLAQAQENDKVVKMLLENGARYTELNDPDHMVPCWIWW